MNTGETSSDLGGVLAGGGEMGALMRTLDWAATPLGRPETWPQSLRTAVSILLNSRYPMFLFWGPALVKIYNDGYRPITGAKHPWALGRPGQVVWPEIWSTIGPMVERVIRHGEATWSADLMLFMERNGFPEEVYFTFSYSPIRDESGGIGGLFCACTETTEKVLGQRRLETLRDLAAAPAETDTVAKACQLSCQVLGGNAADAPFALLYMLNEAGTEARLAAGAGCADDEAYCPPIVDLSEQTGWPLATVARTLRPERINNLSRYFARVPPGPWPEAPHAAMVLPLTAQGHDRAVGLLILGVSSRRPFDDAYADFFSLVGSQIANSIAKARTLEEERRRAEMLAELDRAKTAFFSNVSHEFRTPLTLMLAPTEDALASPERALRGAELETVHRNQLRLLKLVNTLLEFSRIEAGRAQASYEPTNLALLTADLASAFRSAIERGGLRFDVDCPPLPEPICVDREMWEKIVLNLLSNAFKFTFEGSIRVSLRHDGKRVTLQVSDSGVGIPAEELPRVFDRFHRIEGTRSRTHEGSGIGLALVSDLVKLHRGTIALTSQPGVGTTFTVAIPTGCDHLAAERVRPAHTLATSATHAEPYVSEALRWLPGTGEARPITGTAGGIGIGRVLVADDNADMRGYISRLLQEHWEVETAADGEQALRAARERPPDVIVADVMMPNLDGFELLQALRREPASKSIPFIMLSARAGEESRLEGLSAGANDYLVKPFSGKELVARVRVLLEHARLRRAAETERNRLRSVLAQFPAIVNFLRGPELIFEFAHPDVVQRYLSGRDILGKPLLDALPEFRDQEFPTLLRRVVETGERIEGKERRVLHDLGHGQLRESFWNFVYLPVRGDDGRVEGVMTFDLDVTEQVRARLAVEEHATRLAEANARLAAINHEAELARAVADSANRTKDEFLAMLGHELRNPLSPILTALQLMRLRGAETREQAIIERQVGHLVRLVDDLLDVSRITSGKIELRKERLELIQCVLRGLELASPMLEQRRHRVECDVPPEGLPVVGDPDRLAQVVANLLTNAAKYSETDTRVRIHAQRVDQAVVLRVKDEGVGIAADMLDRIFDVFVQQRQALDRSKGGLGLGLAIVRSLVQLHGGSVSATSAGIGRGSEFVVTLPLAPGADDFQSVVTPPPSTLLRLTRPQESARKRVMIVDDNVDAAESMAELLTELGFEVRVAHDGPSALELAGDFEPSVCLLDIGLPVMDGYELARRLRGLAQLPADLRLIAVTGYGQSNDRRLSEAAGFSGHLVKPVSWDVLTRMVLN